MKKQNENNIAAIILIVIIIILVLIRIAFIADKTAEKEALEKDKMNLLSHKDWIEWLMKNRDRNFKIGYLIFKLLVIVLAVVICYVTISLTSPESIIEAIANCNKIFSALGIITIIICFLFEQNPFDIFKAREYCKKFIYSLVSETIKDEESCLPSVEANITITDNKIAEIDKILVENSSTAK